MTEPSLAQLRHMACAQIDRKASEMRLLFISDPVGQQRVYDRKRQEAEAHLAALALDPEAVPGPYLQAEATRCALSAEAVADGVLAAAAMEDTAGPAIEAERVGGKRDVRTAANAAAVATALAASMTALQAVAQMLEPP